MEEWLRRVKEGWNETADSPWYRSLRTEEKLKRIVDDPASAFHPGALEMIKKYVPDMRGVRALLPSSGDNHAAFALAVMGARVTSADISERQLENAAAAAERLGLGMEFVLEDTMTLSKMRDGEFDMVYTSNGTHTWIPDIGGMYRNIARVLKAGGVSVMYDVHPFGRPFTGEAWRQPQVRKAYDDVLPDCHWRVCDLVNAHAEAGLSIMEMAELSAVDASFWYTFAELAEKRGEELEGINDWKRNPMAALPAWIAIAARK